MVIKPKLKGSLALTNHPIGAKEFVKRQIDYIKSQDKYTGPKKVLIIGSSSGYGLASRISLAFGAGADTIGVAFEKGIEGTRIGTAGWWNTIAFTEAAKEEVLLFSAVLAPAAPARLELLAVRRSAYVRGTDGVFFTEVFLVSFGLLESSAFKSGLFHVYFWFSFSHFLFHSSLFKFSFFVLIIQNSLCSCRHVSR